MTTKTGSFSTGRRGPLALQLGLIALAPLPGLVPPAQGTMLIVSAGARPTGETIDWATAHGALLLGTGPLPGSVRVRGSRAALFGPALAHGTLLIGGSGGCGGMGDHSHA